MIDDDVVEASNLQRQIMHRVSDVGARKVDSAVRVAADLSPTTLARPVAALVTADTARDLLAGAHLVVDGTDTFDTREVVAAACEALGVPLVWGVVQEFHAQVTVFWSAPPAPAPAVRLSDLYPPGAAGDVPTCAQVGVLGSLCMQVGALMATEAVKLISGVGEPLVGRVLVIDALRGRTDEVPLRPAAVTGPDATGRDPGPAPTAIPQLSPVEARVAHRDGAVLLDVREPFETARGVIPGSVLMPLAELLADPRRIGTGPGVVVCQVGARAQRAAAALRAAGIEASVLAGGLAEWDRETVPA